MGIALTAISLALIFFYWIRYPRVSYKQILGNPGPHSIHSDLPNLALDVVLEQNRSRVLSRQVNGDVLAWDLKSGKGEKVATTSSVFAYCRTGEQMIVGDKQGFRVMDLKSGTQRQVDGPTYDYAKWSADCSRFALAQEDRTQVEVWNAIDLKKVAVHNTTSPVRNGLALSPDGVYLASAEGTYDEVLGHKTEVELFRIDEQGDIVPAVTIKSPTTIFGMWRMVFASGSNHLLLASQTEARSGLRSFVPEIGKVKWGHDGFKSYWIRALAVSSDGQVLATGDEKGWLRLWNVADGKKLFEGNTGLVIQALSFSEDGNRLALALWDSTIAIVDRTALN